MINVSPGPAQPNRIRRGDTPVKLSFGCTTTSVPQKVTIRYVLPPDVPAHFVTSQGNLRKSVIRERTMQSTQETILKDLTIRLRATDKADMIVDGTVGEGDSHTNPGLKVSWALAIVS